MSLPSTHSGPRSALVTAALLLALVSAGSAPAANYCVGTGEDLAQILNGPGNGHAWNNGEDDIIRLRAGRMTTLAGAVQGPSWVFEYAWEGQSLSISGGWNSDCTTQTIDPTLTILDGRNAGQVLAIDNRRFGFPGALGGAISVSNLTLANGRTFSNPAGALGEVAALNIDVQNVVAGASVVVENVIITGSTAASTADASSVANVSMRLGGFIRFRNNIIHGNNMSGAGATRNLDLSATSNTVAYVSNNSIFSNVASDASVGIDITGVASLYNNVIAENSSTLPGNSRQLYAFDASGLSLTNNHITSMAFGAGSQPAFQNGTTTGPALWTGAGPFRIPDLGSPLRDSGTNSVVGGLAPTDARGLTRIVNTIVDRGAVEAQPPANTGPIISGLQPDAGSTTTLPATSGSTQTTRVFFLTQSGNGTGRTTVNCSVTAGNGAVTVRETQQVSNGGLALPVDVALDNPTAGNGNVTATLVCDVYRENANVYALTYYFLVADPLLFRNGFE
jgi:hypothetical protein